MNLRLLASALFASAFAIANVGCNSAPGRPKPGLTQETTRPDQITDFDTLYSQNCAACHGDHGKNGAAISLANPLYLTFAGEQNLQHIATAGVPGTMMPGFAKSAGGMLTDQQITIITQGMIRAWGKPSLPNDQSIPKYAGSLAADPTQGQKVFGAYCASCHGADAMGFSGKKSIGSLVDPAYLSLISDQGLRTILVAGMPEQGMPNYRSYQGHPLTDQEITDIVAWLVSHRTATPGQIYQQHP
jgi:cytochrome c oxidase cbb3-type subunit 3/ubiquinol-cytochrome c reductase cytochrome c subunit